MQIENLKYTANKNMCEGQGGWRLQRGIAQDMPSAPEPMTVKKRKNVHNKVIAWVVINTHVHEVIGWVVTTHAHKVHG